MRSKKENRIELVLFDLKRSQSPTFPNKMPIILLIRHAENPYLKQGRLAGRIPGVHLNETGRAQAQAVANTLNIKLKDAPVKGIFSSPLERAMETAAPIAQSLGLEITQQEGLIETDCGLWTGKTIKGLKRLRLWKIVQQTPSQFQFPSGETFVECQRRVTAAIESLCAGRDPKDIIICVSHGDPIKLAVAHFLGMPLDNFQRLSISPASTTVLHFSEDGWRLLALNSDLAFTFTKP